MFFLAALEPAEDYPATRRLMIDRQLANIKGTLKTFNRKN